MEMNRKTLLTIWVAIVWLVCSAVGVAEAEHKIPYSDSKSLSLAVKAAASSDDDDIVIAVCQLPFVLVYRHLRLPLTRLA